MTRPGNFPGRLLHTGTMSASIVFHLLATLGYSILGFWLWSDATKSPGPAAAGMAQRVLLTLAVLLHGAGLLQGILPEHALYLGWALALSAALWLGMVIFWVQSLFMRIDGLLLILLPAAALVTLLAGVFPQGHVVPHTQSEWLRIHLLIAFTAYALILVAALHAILMAALDRQLHQPVSNVDNRSLLGRALDSMPPLLTQERLLFQLITISFGVLTLTVITGAVTSQRLLDRPFPLDHKTVFTLLSWATFGILLWGRHTRGWRGRVALRWTLAGFAFVLLAYTGSRFVLDVIL